MEGSPGTTPGTTLGGTRGGTSCFWTGARRGSDGSFTSSPLDSSRDCLCSCVTTRTSRRRSGRRVCAARVPCGASITSGRLAGRTRSRRRRRRRGRIAKTVERSDGGPNTPKGRTKPRPASWARAGTGATWTRPWRRSARWTAARTRQQTSCQCVSPPTTSRTGRLERWRRPSRTTCRIYRLTRRIPGIWR